jgi:hypothetical protein
VGREDHNPVDLDLNYRRSETPKLRTSTKYFNRDVVERWTDPGDAIHWDLDVERPGNFEVTLSYGCEPRDAGARLVIRAGNSTLEHVTQATPGRNIFVPITVGRLDLAQGPATLEIKAVSIAGREPFALHKVWLRRLAG